MQEFYKFFGQMLQKYAHKHLFADISYNLYNQPILEFLNLLKQNNLIINYTLYAEIKNKGKQNCAKVRVFFRFSKHFGKIFSKIKFITGRHIGFSLVKQKSYIKQFGKIFFPLVIAKTSVGFQTASKALKNNKGGTLFAVITK